MAEVQKHVYAGIKLITDQLTDMELNSMCMVALLGTDPRHVQGYEKAAPLFTEENGTKMHATGLDALVLIHEERLQKQQ